MKAEEVVRYLAGIVFVDVAVTDSKRGKKHVCYDPSEGDYFKVGSLTELEDYDEVYIDTLLPSSYGEVGELLNEGKKVYLLREPKLVKKMREQNDLRKSDENDAYILSLIPREFFRELGLREIEMKKQLWPLISRYEILVQRVKVLKQWLKDSNSCRLKDLIRDLEKEKEKIGEEIHHIVMSNELYCQALRYFGLKKSVDLAILVTEIDFSRGKHKIKDYLGLYKKEQKYLKNYNHRLRMHLSSFAEMYHLKILKIKTNKPEKYVEIVEKYKGKRRKILYKIQCKVLEDLRRLYRQTTIQEIQTPAS